LIPVTVVGGYLGSGKTTLVNHLLRNPQGQRLAVLVNEFGELPIDRDLIVGQTEEGFISIAGGCICCSYGSDLVEAMMRLPELATPPDHLLIEASGVALPGAIVNSIALLSSFRADGTVVMVDAETVLDRAQDRYLSDTITRQLADADLIALTRLDLIDNKQANAVRGWLREGWGDTEVVNAVNGQIPPQVLLGLRDGDIARTAATEASTAHDTSVYRTRHWHTSGAIDVNALADLLRLPGNGLLRAKGILRDARGELVTVQLAGRHVTVAPAPTGAATGLVCIGIASRMNLTALDALLGTAAPTGRLGNV
jgi:G3E family GTPase